MTNLQVKKDAWQDYYGFVDIDIDTLQYKNQPQVVYDFYDLYIKRIKEAKTIGNKKNSIRHMII